MLWCMQCSACLVILCRSLHLSPTHTTHSSHSWRNTKITQHSTSLIDNLLLASKRTIHLVSVPWEIKRRKSNMWHEITYYPETAVLWRANGIVIWGKTEATLCALLAFSILRFLLSSFISNSFPISYAVFSISLVHAFCMGKSKLNLSLKRETNSSVKPETKKKTGDGANPRIFPGFNSATYIATATKYRTNFYSVPFNWYIIFSFIST